MEKLRLRGTLGESAPIDVRWREESVAREHSNVHGEARCQEHVPFQRLDKYCGCLLSRKKDERRRDDSKRYGDERREETCHHAAKHASLLFSQHPHCSQFVG